MNYRILLPIIFATLSGNLSAAWKENIEFESAFEEAGVNGTFVYLDPDTGDYVGCNAVRAATRFVPASTFKIPHTVIALSERVVESMDEIIPYGGKPQPFRAWERDMPLREALALSNAAVYQQVAKRIGLERMNKNVQKLCYGNMRIGEDVTRFWLDGPLQITALEQISVLRELVNDGMGFPPAAVSAMKEGIALEAGEEWSLYAKSGWQNAPNAGVGWWVGWIEKGKKLYFFALNMDITSVEDAKKRERLGRKCLSLAGLLNKSSNAE